MLFFTRLAAVFILFRFSSCQVRRDLGRAAQDEYPHQVSLVVTDEKNEGYRAMFGSGTLISDRWVLTAAHNFESHKVIGRAKTAEVRIPSTGLSAEVEKWYAHPTYDLDQVLADEYDTYRLEMIDVALVKLKAPFMDGDQPANVKTASLPRLNEEIEDFSDVRFAGYGDNDHVNDTVLYKARSVKLPIYYCGVLQEELQYDEDHNMDVAHEMFDKFEIKLNDEDKKKIKEFSNDIGYHSHICTGVKNPNDIGPYITSGDSGCGLFKPEGDTVYGVLSTSNYEKEHDQQFTRPALWVKVSECLDFIEETMEKHEGRQEGSLNFVAALAALICACVYFL